MCNNDCCTGKLFCIDGLIFGMDENIYASSMLCYWAIFIPTELSKIWLLRNVVTWEVQMLTTNEITFCKLFCHKQLCTPPSQFILLFCNIRCRLKTMHKIMGSPHLLMEVGLEAVVRLLVRTCVMHPMLLQYHRRSWENILPIIIEQGMMVIQW